VLQDICPTPNLIKAGGRGKDGSERERVKLV